MPVTTISEPLGRSIMNTTMMPYRLSRALVNYFIDLMGQDPILLQERQALVLGLLQHASVELDLR